MNFGRPIMSTAVVFFTWKNDRSHFRHDSRPRIRGKIELRRGKTVAAPHWVISLGVLRFSGSGTTCVRNLKYLDQRLMEGQRPRYPSVKEMKADKVVMALAGR